jgi:hydroxyacylglutathione hydrolase
MIYVEAIPAFQDNYLWGLWDHDNAKVVAVVDPGDANEIFSWLDAGDRHLETILLTHHHPDHIGGVNALRNRYPDVQVWGPWGDSRKIDFDYNTLDDLDEVDVLGNLAQVISVPGHTAGHLAYWFDADAKVFVGDTLFSAGCGRMFEGTAEQMWNSLVRLRALPDFTEVYCAHEYTQSNCRFALSVDPNNEALILYADEVNLLRSAHKPTIPTTIGLEKTFNPFLRADDQRFGAQICQQFNLSPQSPPHEVFGALRSAKDHFRG